MISLADFTSFDVIVALVFIVFIVRGGWIGFMRQLAAFLALVGSYWLAGRYCSQLMPYVDDFIQNPKLVFFISFALLFCLSALLFILGGKVLHRVMEISLLGWFDRLLGVLLGVVKGVVLTSFLYMVLASSLSASNDLLKKSISAPYLAMGADILHQIIQDPQLRKYFVPREPAIKDGILKDKKTGKKKIQPDRVPHK